MIMTDSILARPMELNTYVHSSCLHGSNGHNLYIEEASNMRNYVTSVCAINSNLCVFQPTRFKL